MMGKKQIAAVVLACVMLTVSSCGKIMSEKKQGTTDADAVSSEKASSALESGHRFDPEDCRVRNINPGMDLDEVKGILGKPDYEYYVEDDEMLGEYIGLEYPGMTLCFDPDSDNQFRLSCIYLRDDSVRLANGLHVGNTLYEVVNAFDNPQNITFKEDSDFFDNTLYVYNSSHFIPGIFDSDWPDEPVQAAYCFDYRSENAPLMYVYCEPPVWNRDRTGYSMTSYNLYFRTTLGDDKITQIDIVKTTEQLSKGD